MAFKELGKLCSMHMPNTEERGLTKLGTLLRAVDLIPMLEEQVCFINLILNIIYFIVRFDNVISILK